MTTVWLEWIGGASIHLVLIVPVIYAVDRVIERRTWPWFQSALWTVALCRLLFPPSAWWLPATDAALPRTISALVLPVPVQPDRRLELLIGLWALGVGLLAVLAIARYARTTTRFLRGAAAPLPAALTDLVAGSARALGLRSVPPVIVRDDVHGPFVVGVFRPAVVLPSFMLREREELEHVLLHELAHVKRRDPLVNALCLVLHLVYWFHPLVWLARRRLVTLREVACDVRVVAAGGSRDRYRTTLLRLARGMVTESRQPVLRFFGSAGQLLTRLTVLERPIRPASRLQWAASVALCVVMLAAFAVLARPVVNAADPDVIGPAGCLRWRFAVYAELAAEMKGESTR